MIGFVWLTAAAMIGIQGDKPPPGDEQSPRTTVQAISLGRLDIPDEIARAIVPYMDCLFESQGTRVMSDGVRQRPTVALGTDCTSHRERAARQAENMLRNQGRGGRTERRAYVEAVLARVDAFAGNVPAVGSRLTPAMPASVVRTPGMLALPGQIGPALMPYVQCMISDNQQRLMGVSTGEAARAAVARLLGDCRSARDTAEQRSRERLERSDVSESDRERIISEALVSVDHMRDDVAEHLDQVNARRERVEGQHDASN